MSQTLLAALQAMLGPGAGVGLAEVSGTEGAFDEELHAVRRAIPKRRAEFAAGRRAARAALRALGRPEVAIPAGDDRAPQWPEGIRGAITHDGGLALAAVTAKGGIGIDLTEAAPLPGDTRRAILPHDSEQGFDALSERAGFSAKESLFKALYPFVETYFGFSAARVHPAHAAGSFRIALTESLGPFPAGQAWTGRILVQDGRLLTALSLAKD